MKSSETLGFRTNNFVWFFLSIREHFPMFLNCNFLYGRNTNIIYQASQRLDILELGVILGTSPGLTAVSETLLMSGISSGHTCLSLVPQTQLGQSRVPQCSLSTPILDLACLLKECLLHENSQWLKASFPILELCICFTWVSQSVSRGSWLWSLLTWVYLKQ